MPLNECKEECKFFGANCRGIQYNEDASTCELLADDAIALFGVGEVLHRQVTSDATVARFDNKA